MGLDLVSGPVLAFVGIWDLVCNILSLVLLNYYTFSFEVGGLGHYVFLLDWWPGSLCGSAWLVIYLVILFVEVYVGSLGRVVALVYLDIVHQSPSF